MILLYWRHLAMQCIITSVLTNQKRDEVTQWLSDIFRNFSNFLGHKNEVYGKLKPLQEKVKYTFFSKLYYRVSRKKISSKNQPSYRHVGLEKGSFLTIKMIVTNQCFGEKVAKQVDWSQRFANEIYFICIHWYLKNAAISQYQDHELSLSIKVVLVETH